jgi:apolipoprotein N-acyltransferase
VKATGLYLLAALLAFLGALVAYVALAYRGIDTSGLLAVSVPVISALLLAAKVDAVHQVADQVQHQTNGVLDERLKSAVRQVMQEAEAIRQHFEGRPPVDPPSTPPPVS